MCGGLAFPAKNISSDELEKWFSPGEIEEIGKSGIAQTFFQSRKPFLPIRDGEKVRLVNWGNRNKEVKLPLTGWAKQESIDLGKWLWLQPQLIEIPVLRGCEKKEWFEVPEGAFKGLLINKDGRDAAYMITMAADENYLKKLHHDRQPVVVDY